MLNELYADIKDKMHKSVEAIERELSTVRAGKASPHLLDPVKVEAYGTTMPLNQVATVNAPEPRMLTVQPYDKSTVGDIIKGIQKADLGLNPMADGQMIRIVIPALNEERRRELGKHCHDIAERGRVSIRNIRREANEKAKQLMKDKHISEDQEKDALDEIQKMTDESIKKIDSDLAKKEKELMEV